MTVLEDQLKAQLDQLGSKLARRATTERLLDRYFDGKTPLPQVVLQARVTKAYNMLIGQSTAPWGAIVVDSVLDRLSVTGIKSDDPAVDQALWDVWQAQKLDAESPLVHRSALISGRAYGLVWPDAVTGAPDITFDSSAQMIVKYVEGSRRKRVAAMRYWKDDDTHRPFANLYRPDAIFKFQGPQDTTGPDGVTWQRRDVPDEPWPVPNPFGIVPVVEFPVNRRLTPGPWGHARGEFEHVTPLIDRVNLLTFLGLVVGFSLGFPMRAVIGDKILYDDDGNQLPPFELAADSVIQFENPDTKLATFPAADRATLSIGEELEELAALTHTPITSFPRAGRISNISADTIRALEGGLMAKIPPHHATLGEGWEELLRIAGLMLDQPIVLSPRAELQWADHETRSLAERADAAVKLKDILPQTALLEYVLNLTTDQIARYQTQQATDVMGQLLAAAVKPAVPAPPARTNGQP